MSREIKFRVWDTIDKKFYGDMSTRITFASTAGQYNKFSPEFDILELSRPNSNGKLFSTGKSVYDLIFQQFTGLKDKNGREIYEGDIIKVSNTRTDTNSGGRDGNYRIEYYNGSFWAGGLNCLSMFILRGQIFEVIGNTFENPELLK